MERSIQCFTRIVKVGYLWTDLKMMTDELAGSVAFGDMREDLGSGVAALINEDFRLDA